MSKRAFLFSSGAALAVAALVGILLMSGLFGATADPGPTRPSHQQTGTVERGTLTGTSTQSGKLTRLEGPAINAGISGTLTGMPKIGDTLKARDVLYHVNDQPVTAFEGALPQWRPFESGMSEGPDVMQLETNLQAWGYLINEPDEEFDWGTQNAIIDWQNDTGQETTGSIEMGRIVFLTGEIVISERKAVLGDQIGGGPLLGTKRTERVVMVDVPVGSQLAKIGGVVSIHLPNGIDAPGKVQSIGEPIIKDDGKTMMPLTLSFDVPNAPGKLSEASASVKFVSEVKEDVLSVPVVALGAKSGGGYIIEVINDDGSSTPKPVTVGLFAGDRVEVSGEGITDGQKVVVPQT